MNNELPFFICPHLCEFRCMVYCVYTYNDNKLYYYYYNAELCIAIVDTHLYMVGDLSVSGKLAMLV